MVVGMLNGDDKNKICKNIKKRTIVFLFVCLNLNMKLTIICLIVLFCLNVIQSTKIELNEKELKKENFISSNSTCPFLLQELKNAIQYDDFCFNTNVN